MHKISLKSSQQVYHVVQKAKKNYIKIRQYFTGQQCDDCLVNTLRDIYFQNNCQMTSQVYNISTNQILQLKFYLNHSLELISRTFQNISNKDRDQYRFLRNVWIQHEKRMQSRSELSERIDGINQVVSMLKMRMRSLTNTTYNEILSEQNVDEIPIEQQKSIVFEHPLIQKLQKQFCSCRLQLEQKSQRLMNEIEKNNKLFREYQQLQKKHLQMIDKNKQSNKTIFQITKNKVALQKKIFDLQKNGKQTYKYIDKQNMSKNTNLNSSKQLQSFTKQEVQTNKPENCVNNQKQYKFKCMKKNGLIRHRYPTQTSPNTSIDSIKTLRFQRTNSKKSFKCNTLQKSVCIQQQNNQ